MSGELYQATCVAIEGRGLMIEGSPGSGKSSLALALIDRGAMLIGDDGVLLEPRGDRLHASPDRPSSASSRSATSACSISRHWPTWRSRLC